MGAGAKVVGALASIGYFCADAWIARSRSLYKVKIACALGFWWVPAALGNKM